MLFELNFMFYLAKNTITYLRNITEAVLVGPFNIIILLILNFRTAINLFIFRILL